MPRPNSALSSNSELDQAGPRPSASVDHGVVGGDLDGHPRIREVLAPPLLVGEARGAVVEGSRVVDLHADGGMGADQRALGAVDADLGVPDGDLGRDGALLPTAGPGGEGPV